MPEKSDVLNPQPIILHLLDFLVIRKAVCFGFRVLNLGYGLSFSVHCAKFFRSEQKIPKNAFCGLIYYLDFTFIKFLL